MLALSIFPVSHPTSIVDEFELNFCVRYGNRWTLKPISTNYILHTHALIKVVTRTGFEPMLKA